MKNSEMSISLQVEGAEQAAEVLERVALAAEKAKQAIDSLNSAAHGGVTVQIVGNLAQVKIAPFGG